MSARLLSRSMTRAATSANLAAAHSAVTIAARLPILTGCFFSPTASALAEWNRAYSEKVAAALEGAAAASAEWQTVMLRAASRHPSAAGIANDCMRIAHKAGDPARRRVRANAKRLARAKAKKADNKG